MIIPFLLYQTKKLGIDIWFLNFWRLHYFCLFEHTCWMVFCCWHTHTVTDSSHLQIVSELAIVALPNLEFEKILQASWSWTWFSISIGIFVKLYPRFLSFLTSHKLTLVSYVRVWVLFVKISVFNFVWIQFLLVSFCCYFWVWKYSSFSMIDCVCRWWNEM